MGFIPRRREYVTLRKIERFPVLLAGMRSGGTPLNAYLVCSGFDAETMVIEAPWVRGTAKEIADEYNGAAQIIALQSTWLAAHRASSSRPNELRYTADPRVDDGGTARARARQVPDSSPCRRKQSLCGFRKLPLGAAEHEHGHVPRWYAALEGLLAIP